LRYQTFPVSAPSLLCWSNAAKPLVKLGVPQGTSEEHKGDFGKGLIKFNEALAKFKADASKGTDEQVTASYTAVHDSFEMLAAMLPRG